MTYRSIGLTTEQALKDAFKQAKIEAIIHSFRPLANVEAIIDTTEHDAKIREDERRKVLHEQRALEINLQISAEELRADAIRKFAEWLANNKKYNPMKDDIGFAWSDEVHFSTVDEVLAEYEKENNNA